MGTNLNPNMTTRSMFGSQPLSARRSAASYGFGSSTRDHQAKLFISQAHSATAGYGLGSPGPATYGLRASVGRQEDARKASAPSYGFSTNERFTVSKDTDAANAPLGGFSASSFGNQASSSTASQPKFGFGSAHRNQMERVFISEEHNKSMFGKHSPGPCSYTLKGAMGKQDASRLNGNAATQPAWAFGSTKRFQYDHVKRAMNSPGPGSYAMTASVGKQSTRESAPIFGFGSSTRENQAKVYMSPEHEKGNFGRGSPGPCTYTLQQSVGTQRLSKDHSSASWGFGTADRWSGGPRSSDMSPGPGSYCI
jgi:hypothetical protein